VVKKTDPEEKVGVICKVEDKFQVVEYSEISPKCRNLRKGDSENEEDNELVFNAGNICNHFFRKDFLDTVCVEREKELKHHIAEKKIAFVDEESGLRVVPKEVNGIKLEKFVFDVFPFSE
jgi:UDP-N-acetylglucosamine/UDP-N-acetylgalactosamine diphosphorylase